MPERVGLDFYLNGEERLGAIIAELEGLQDDDMVWGRAFGREDGDPMGMIDRFFDKDDCEEDREVVERCVEAMQGANQSILDMSDVVLCHMITSLEGLMARGYSDEDFLQMVLDQYRHYWYKVWHKEGVMMKEELELMDSDEERMRSLKGMKRELNRRMKGSCFNGLQSDFLDEEGKGCRYEDFFKELKRQRGVLVWTIEDLNEYFDIVIRRRFVEDMMNRRSGALRYQSLFKVEKSKQEMPVVHPNMPIYSDLEWMLRNVGGCVKRPYRLEGVLELMRWLLMGESTDEGELEGRKEFLKFITNGTVRAHRLGTIGLNHFYRLLKLLIECGVMTLGDTYGTVIRQAVGERWGELKLEVSTFEGCFSESWGSKMGLKFPRIEEMVEGYLQRG